MSKPEIVQRSPVNIACMRHVGPYGEEVGEFWQQAVMPWLNAKGLLQQARYGIGRDDPSTTPPAECRYDAGIEVPAGYAPDPGVTVSTLPGGSYLVQQFRGTPESIGAAWVQLFGQWLPASGRAMGDGPCFEHYPSGAFEDLQTGEFECELCVPLADA